MDNTTDELNNLFAPPPTTELSPDISGELQSILRLHGISPQELFFKWESYSIKMGSEETKLDLVTVRAFKKDVQESLERETRGKVHVRNADKRNTGHAASRNTGGNEDVFGMLDDLVPNTPRPGAPNGYKGSTVKRKANFDTSATAKVSKAASNISPGGSKIAKDGAREVSNGLQAISFADRPNAGQAIETLNDHLPSHEAPIAPSSEPRIKLIANSDLKKFSYKPMAMHLSEASEVLDDRIDEFMNLVQLHHGLDDSAFGNAASQSTNEIVAVGRIASDMLEGKLNSASIVLETSRRMGAGLRVPLKLDSVVSYEFFPGKIVALRGVNASGEYFSVKEILSVPLLPPAASLPGTLDELNARLGFDTEESSEGTPLNILAASGPYTTDDSLAFEPLQAICDKVSSTYADALILTGPFLDLEHPMLASGDFELPEDATHEPDKATLNDVFRILVGTPLRRLAQQVPGITIILIPSVRDAVSKHVSWPQEAVPKKELGLPKQAKFVTNPVMLSLNEIVVGISSQDILYELRREEVVGGKPTAGNLLARLSRYTIEQRHFYPLFPPVAREHMPKSGIMNGLATGATLDTSYLKLSEWLNVRPDVLIMPSSLSPFAKIVESVLVVNPGTLSKRKGAGTYTQMSVHPRKVTDEERAEAKMVGHQMFERTRVDIMKI